MTAPKRDSRSLLERAREMRKWSAWDFHDRSGEAQVVFMELLQVVERALEHPLVHALTHLGVAITRIRSPYQTENGCPTRDTIAKFHGADF